MRYFLEVSYSGERYGGFQIQTNTPTIQSEVERVLAVYFRSPVKLTGASRTDAGVNALKNYFHFDTGHPVSERLIYNLNAMLPVDIAVRSIKQVRPDAHARFDATSRKYQYYIYNFKNPFLFNRAWYHPYPLDILRLQEAAAILLGYSDFTAFSKRNSQVNNHICHLHRSEWSTDDHCLVYAVEANRFLRGMVRGLVGTMVEVGQGKRTPADFRKIIEAGDQTKANFSPPGKGLFLVNVHYPENIFL
ncbi:tRNA pseudouridine(38-40) synthase TruA [Segetibacter sp. 3557_3]|uniref:tRNA pseudouridine(38-40) synthase TruA n=1 Tax=Segetibacter sp. 3557_3 TaxID=2547429 RepID=UPI001058F85D|nr:tRNA pseudouridine(38-40) synthase TruA [Segetibacter sp. 3557_3]TDH26044.1 tRNA pseudouridine(38-40) synthase TruA [Segetibacter sp. 3557_3]